MLNKAMRKEAEQQLQMEVDQYNDLTKQVNPKMTELKETRDALFEESDRLQNTLNQFKNTPKEFNVTLSEIKVNIKNYKSTLDVAQKEMVDAEKAAGGSAVAGALAGTAVAALAPSAAMGIATLFGTASTGAAISGLSGAAATNAALAWLGGGALTAGGLGTAGGEALLGLAGPIGWGIAGATAAGASLFLSGKNKKAAEEMNEQQQEVHKASQLLQGILREAEQMTVLTKNVKERLDLLRKNILLLSSNDYDLLVNSEKNELGIAVNSLAASSSLLNMILGENGEFDKEQLKSVKAVMMIA